MNKEIEDTELEDEEFETEEEEVVKTEEETEAPTETYVVSEQSKGLFITNSLTGEVADLTKESGTALIFAKILNTVERIDTATNG